jgi:hypothetical protein
MLASYTDEQLLQELERRKQPPIKIVPVLVENPDFTPLIELCKTYIKEVSINGIEDDSDWRYWFYETILTAVYGKNIFEWINTVKR